MTHMFAAASLAAIVLTLMVLFGAPAQSGHPAAPAASAVTAVK